MKLNLQHSILSEKLNELPVNHKHMNHANYMHILEKEAVHDCFANTYAGEGTLDDCFVKNDGMINT